MSEARNEVKLVLIAGLTSRANLLHDTLAKVGVDADMRILAPGPGAIDCVRQGSAYRRNPLPDLFFFDFTHPDEQTISVLRSIAFGPEKAKAPVVVLTSPESLELLDAGDIDGGEAVMFSPTGLVSFARKMQRGNRSRFFNALRTLYQFGPILVRIPQSVLSRDRRELAKSA